MKCVKSSKAPSNMFCNDIMKQSGKNEVCISFNVGLIKTNVQIMKRIKSSKVKFDVKCDDKSRDFMKHSRNDKVSARFSVMVNNTRIMKRVKSGKGPLYTICNDKSHNIMMHAAQIKVFIRFSLMTKIMHIIKRVESLGDVLNVQFDGKTRGFMKHAGKLKVGILSHSIQCQGMYKL
jgi:hypothetical protein